MLPDINVSLECLCADDFGASWVDEDERSEDEQAHVQTFEETRSCQLAAKQLIEGSGIAAVVDVMDTADRDSEHSDCYVRFNLRDLPRVVTLLDQAGLPGDILDVDVDALEPETIQWIEDNLYWTVEDAAPRGALNTTSTGYHVTAIATSGASAPLRHLLSSRPSWVKGKVLDFGTGRGRDCKALKKRGISVSCYDPHHPKPSMTQLPSGRFGLVLATYVVNVLPPKERRAAIRRMGSKVAPKGRLVVAARGCGDAGGRQTAASWTKHQDGRQDDDGRFQRFFGPGELASQVKAALGSGWTRCELPQGDRGFAMTAWMRA